MSAKSTKLILIMCLLLTLLLPILACVTSPDPNSTSIIDLDITMEVNQLGEFRNQLQNFADKHSLDYTEKFYNADKTYFSVVVMNDNLEFLLNNSKHSLSTVGISLYNKASPSLAQEEFDELVIDLKSFINEIPNVKITERIKGLKVNTADSQREKIFAESFLQLQTLADKYSLEFRELSYDEDLETFFVEMQGMGFRITVKAIPNPPGEFALIFYMDFDNNVAPTSNPSPSEIVDELINNLKSSLGENPNVMITEIH